MLEAKFRYFKLLNLLKLQLSKQMVKLFQFYLYVGMGKQ